MRCRECNVDLGEEYTKCPLCGGTAYADEPILKGMKTVSYPKYDDKVLLEEKNEFHSDFPQKYVLRAALVICLILSVAAIFTTDKLWSIGVTSVLSATSLFYFIAGCMEKGRLLHSAVSLVGIAAVSVILIVVAAIVKCGIAAMAISLGVCAVAFLMLFAVKPQKMISQLGALFSL